MTHHFLFKAFWSPATIWKLGSFLSRQLWGQLPMWLKCSGEFGYVQDQLFFTYYCQDILQFVLPHGCIIKPDLIRRIERACIGVVWFLPKGTASWISFCHVFLKASHRTTGISGQCHYYRLTLVFVVAILGDPGSGLLVGTMWYFGAKVYFKSWRAPGILLLTDQFRSQLKSLSVIGHKNLFVPNQSPAIFVLLSWLLIRRCSPTNCSMACSPYLSASCRRVSLDRELPLKGEPWNRKNSPNLACL